MFTHHSTRLRNFPVLGRIYAGVWLVALLAGCSEGEAGEKKPTAAQLEFFEKSVRPVLVDKCFSCHGEEKQRGGLRLDSRGAVMEGGDSGPAMVPGQPGKSLVVKAIHYKDELKMPPKTPLNQEQVAALTLWIQQGAFWPESAKELRPAVKESGFKISAEDRAFWSFQPIVPPSPPKVRNFEAAKTPIDAFILAKLEEKGLAPAGPADRRTLIRRVTFDLIGLPPTPEEVDAFLNDKPPDAFARVVDRLLASPHYGERWARHWLDVSRYGEDQAHTFQARKYPQGFRYRDWVVKAFNDDMAYDRFVKEQIAADLLPEPDRVENLAALGFFALGPVYYGDPKKLDQIDDRIDTVTRGFLGLTVACARCHDHKYDPISTKDYYSLAGIVASSDYVELSLESGQEGKPVEPVVGKDKKKTPFKGPFLHSIKEGKPADMRVHVRGNAASLGEQAPRGFLSILCKDTPQPVKSGSGRLELANAIASRDNPLTARVLVNRVWRHHFGKGLVRTPSNFGALGERPTHPELLDHLAYEFMASGWSIKKLHRTILTSAAYQRSSQAEPKANEIDPENKLLWRMNRRRLEVEAWRDAMLAVAGTLDPALGGPSTDLNSAGNRRRTLYGSVSRHELNPLLRLFDFPDPNITSDERPHTTVPLQQLFVLNSEFMVGNAKALTKRLHQDNKLDDAARIRRAMPLLFARPATEREVKIGLAFLNAPSTEKTSLSRWEQYSQVLLSTNEFLYVD